MNQFLDSLLTRHTDTGSHVKPRLRSRFEPALQSSAFVPGSDSPEPQKGAFAPEADDMTFSAANQTRRNNWPPDKFDWEHGHSARLNTAESRPNRLHDGPNPEPLPWQETPELNASRTQPVANHQPDRYPDHIPVPFIQSASQPGLSIGNPARQAATWEETEPASAQNHRQGLLGEPPALRTNRQAFDPAPSLRFEQAAPLPTIRVTIGRIDVRAVQQSTSSGVGNAARPKPELSLEDYLKQRTKRDS